MKSYYTEGSSHGVIEGKPTNLVLSWRKTTEKKLVKIVSLQDKISTQYTLGGKKSSHSVAMFNDMIENKYVQNF